MAKIAAANAMSEHAGKPKPIRSELPPLSPSVRRHLGKTLRSFYAASLAEPVSGPVSERLDALLAKLESAAREPKG